MLHAIQLLVHAACTSTTSTSNVGPDAWRTRQAKRIFGVFDFFLRGLGRSFRTGTRCVQYSLARLFPLPHSPPVARPLQACMGLSAEPVVEAVMVPQIKELMDASIWRSWPKQRPKKNTITLWAAHILQIAFSLYLNVFGLIPVVQKLITLVRPTCTLHTANN